MLFTESVPLSEVDLGETAMLKCGCTIRVVAQNADRCEIRLVKSCCAHHGRLFDRPPMQPVQFCGTRRVKVDPLRRALPRIEE
jgi:hypothetical protein